MSEERPDGRFRPIVLGESASKHSSRQAVTEWMNDVLVERRWSARTWATRAGVAASTITRTITGGNVLPSMQTIEKLAIAAGRWPDAEWIGNRAGSISAHEIEPLLERLFKLLKIESVDAHTINLLSRASAIGLEKMLRLSSSPSSTVPLEIASYEAARWLSARISR